MKSNQNLCLGFTRLFLLVLATGALPCLAQPHDPSNQILFRVNDHIATSYDYQRAVADRKRAINSQPGLTAERREELLENVEERVMSDLFEELLVRSRADQLGLAVTDFEVDQMIAEMRQANGIENDEQLQSALSREGMTLNDLRERFRLEETRRAVVSREIRSRINIGDDDLREIYRDNQEDFRVPEQVQVEEIIVLDGTGAGELAKKVSSALASGSSFAEVKEQHGDRLSGVIEVGWVSPGDLDPVLEEAVWALEEGQYSPPTAARGGLHILRAAERKESNVLPFEEVKDRIYRREFGRRMGDEYEKYLDELAVSSYRKCAPSAAEFCKERAASALGASPPLDVDRLFRDVKEADPAVTNEDGEPSEEKGS